MNLHCLNTMKTAMLYVLMVGCMLLIMTGHHTAMATTRPPAAGEMLPDIQLQVPKNPDHRAYLGVEGATPFTIPQIDADIVIVEIFSMY